MTTNTPAHPLKKEEVDYLIIGQGLCGTFLSRYLLQAGKKVIIVDNNKPVTASKVASGVINPVTGRRIVRTWMIEDLLPFATREYSQLAAQLGINLPQECSVFDFHPSLQMREAFDHRLKEENVYLHSAEEAAWKPMFHFHFGVGRIRPCLLVDTLSLLSTWRTKLQEKDCLADETFDGHHLSLFDDHITYKNITATKAIFCDGVDGIHNPFFKNLPYAPNKGEAIIASIQDLDASNIYKHGLSIVPWKAGLFWIGSTYEWNFQDNLPTMAFRQKVEYFLKNFLKLPFQIVEQLASIRPANLERRPFVGLHPAHPTIGILNGMGTKGCSLAPYFARQLCDFLVEGIPISPEADVKRFEKTLARQMN